jgi:hypothetical protein
MFSRVGISQISSSFDVFLVTLIHGMLEIEEEKEESTKYVFLFNHLPRAFLCRPALQSRRSSPPLILNPRASSYPPPDCSGRW